MSSRHDECAVEIVVPAHDEEADLAQSVERLPAYLERRFPFSYRITIADHASADGTWAIAQELAERAGLRIHEVAVDCWVAHRLTDSLPGSQDRHRSMQYVWNALRKGVLTRLLRGFWPRLIGSRELWSADELDVAPRGRPPIARRKEIIGS